MKKFAAKALRSNEFYVLLVIIALGIVIQARSGQFFTVNNLVDIANAMVVPGLFAIGAFWSSFPAASTSPSPPSPR